MSSSDNETMISPSRERLDDLARELFATLSRSRTVIFLKDSTPALQAVTQALTEELRREEERQANARRRISELDDAPPGGSKEWQDLFRRLVEDEYLRDGLEG
jgi:hypothetical protein